MILRLPSDLHDGTDFQKMPAQKLGEMFIAVAARVNGNKSHVYIWTDYDDIRAVQVVTEALAAKITMYPSLKEDAYLKPIVNALAKVRRIDNARAVADAVKDVELPGFKPAPPNPFA